VQRLLLRRDLQFLILVVIAAGLWSCTPKQVRLYEVGAEIRNDVIQQAIGVLGKPYRSGAKGPDAFDCSGLIHYVYKRVSIILPVVAEKQIEAGSDVLSPSVLPGDLVFFKIKKDFHAGIMLNKKDFIHSSASRGVSVDNLESNYWKRNFLCFRSVLQ
jgi:cell wall-associated NlpC family hydrolase